MSDRTTERQWVPSDTFANRLVLVRRQLGLKQRDAADQCGFSAATWNAWEHGRGPAHVAPIATQIATRLDVDPDWLIHGGPLATVADLDAVRVDRRRHRRGRRINRAFLSSTRGHLRLHRTAA